MGRAHRCASRSYPYISCLEFNVVLIRSVYNMYTIPAALSEAAVGTARNTPPPGMLASTSSNAVRVIFVNHRQLCNYVTSFRFFKKIPSCFWRNFSDVLKSFQVSGENVWKWANRYGFGTSLRVSFIELPGANHVIVRDVIEVRIVTRLGAFVATRVMIIHILDWSIWGETPVLRRIRGYPAA